MTKILSLAVPLLCAFATASAAADGRLARSSENNFASFSIGSSAPAPSGTTRYLHLQGLIPNADADAVLKELDTAFLAPLRPKPAAALFGSIDEIDGSGHFWLNLILEPTSPANAGAVDAYVARMQAQGFHGFPVVFQDVRKISLNASLQIGMYTPSTEDAFTMHENVDSLSDFPSIASWLASYDVMALGVTDKSHAAFLGFVRKFVGDPAKFKNLRRKVLPANNMIELVTRITIGLPGGVIAGPDFDTGPFLPFSFIRSCFDPKFENGMCGGTPPRVAARKQPEAVVRGLLPSASLDWN